MAADLNHRAISVAHVATIDVTVRVLLMPQLRALREAGYAVTAISAPGEFAEEIEAEGIAFLPWVNATRAWDPWSDLRAFAELGAILRRGAFDLVHTHNAKPGVMGRIAARMVGVPCVVNTVHGFDATPDDPRRKRVAFMGLEWMAAQFSDMELFQGRADLLRSKRLAMKSPPKRRFIGNGTDLIRFRPDAVGQQQRKALRRDLGIPDEARVVGMVGRLVAEKGYRELFMAAPEVRALVPEARFIVVGERDEAKADGITDLEMKQAEANGVSFLGWRADMPELFSTMDVFTLPSWREGVPRSAIEAATTGLPLVLSDIPGCREVCRPGIDGFLVPPRDPLALASALRTLLADEDLRIRMSAAARRHAEARFDEREVVRRVLEVYDGVLRRKLIAR
jgi:glycosyltransferase involved in cell wall biosynthesis